MLRILEQKDLSAYAALLAKLQIPAGTELHLSEATENDTVKGYICYSYQPEKVVIYAVDDGHDLNYCDGLVRSVLFKAELKGIAGAVFLVNDTAMKERLKLLGFVKNNENVIENIADIMENCKKCEEKHTNT